MPKTYRRIILIVAGVAILGFSAYGYLQIARATEDPFLKENYQPAVSPRLPVTIHGQQQTKAYEPNCQQPRNQGDADLCAQWAAVKTVAESNRLVRLGILLTYALGILGALITTVGTYLVYQTLRQSDKSLSAARESLSHAERVSALDLRPWVSFELAIKRVECVKGSHLTYFTEIQVMNSGSTAATDVHIRLSADTRDIVPPQAFLDRYLIEAGNAEISGQGEIVMPNQPVVRELATFLWAPQIAQTGQATTVHGIVASITYKSEITGIIHQTGRHFIVNGLIEPEFRIEQAETADLDLSRLKVSSGITRAT